MNTAQLNQINTNLNKLHALGLEIATTDIETAARLHSIMIDLEMSLFNNEEEPSSDKITQEALENIIMESSPTDVFYLRNGILYRNNYEGSNPEPIGDISEIPLTVVDELVNK